MIFEQEKDTNVITIQCGEPNKLVYPEVGKIYNAFDDGKVRRSRLMKFKITKVIDLDKDKVSKSLLKMLAREIKECDWVYDKEQTIIYRAKALKDDNTYYKELGYCYFLKTQDNTWFSVGMGWFDSLLDVDGHLWKAVLEEEAEMEREEKFRDEAKDILASVFPKIRDVDYAGDLFKELSNEDFDLAKRTLEVQYGIVLNEKRCKYLEKNKWDLLGQVYYTLYPKAYSGTHDFSDLED